MKNKIKTVMGAVISALCFLTAFFGVNTQVQAESGQLVHRHTGNRQDGGGCYGTKRTSTYICGSYNISVRPNGTNYTYVCGMCGNKWVLPHELGGTQCNAEKEDTYYELSCGRDGASAVSFSCEKSTQGWTKELDLTASYSVHEDGISVSGYLWNGSPGGASYHVTENGTYTLGLIGSGNTDFSSRISVKVDHIDHTAPAIESFQAVSDAWGSLALLQVSASDTGAGLAGEAYSYDGGATWSSSDTYTVSANGTYQVHVRDAIGNVSMAETTVEHVDCEPPAVSVSTSPSADNWYDGSLTVILHAQDAGSGLNDAPYSFDGGATYLVGNSATLSGSGTLEIAVSDRAGNVTRLSFHAEKKERPTPAPGGAGNGGGGGNAGNGGTGNVGSGSAGNSAGTGGTSGNTGSGTGNIGNSGSGTENSGTGNTGSSAGTGATGGSGEAGEGVAGAGTGGSGADQAGAGGTAAGSSAAGGTGTNPERGAGLGSIGGGTGSVKGSGNGSAGAQGSQNNGGNDAGGSESKRFHDNGKQRGAGENGLSGAAGGNGRNDPGMDGNAQSEMTGTLPQHYPGGLPRVSGMKGGRQDENGSDGRMGGANGMDGTNGADDAAGGGTSDAGSAGTSGMNEADEAGNTGVSVEESIIQNELLSAADGQEAAVLQRTGSASGTEVPIGSMPMLAVCAAVLAAAVLSGWCLLFGVRIDTKDEKGHYRFAGMTRVTRKEQDRLRVVPLTRQIIRNSHTNELRVRFAPLCCKRYEGETLLLRYRSMKREFKAQRTVELHIRA